MRSFDLRERKGAAVCLLGILLNLLLAAGKIAAGLLTGFLSVTADGFNNLGDCGSGIVSLATFFIARKPADERHPFGHRRAEYVAAMIVGFFVLFLAAELARESVGAVVRGGEGGAAWWIYLILGISVAVKLAMFALYLLFAKKLDSDALKASAADSLCDSLATLAVVAGTARCSVAPSADGWAGIVVSLFIVWQGIKILMDAGSKLLGQAPDPALAERVRETVLSSDGVLGVHDLRIYSYGKGVSFATIHAEMDASVSMLAAHTVIDGAEARVRAETGVVLTVHLDPVDLTNREESSLKIKVREQARELAEGLELHDFRLVPDTNKVEFDVSVPYSCKRTDGELQAALVAIVKQYGEYEPIVTIDRD